MNILRIIIVFILLVFIVPLAHSEELPSVNLSVTARIKSNVHIEWEKIPSSDPRYMAFAKKQNMSVLKEGERALQLPFALVVKLRTNDPTKIVKIHVDNLKSENGQKTIPAEKLYISINGNRYEPFTEDVVLLQQKEGNELKDLVVLFRLHATMTDKAGKYSANFSFTTSAIL